MWTRLKNNIRAMILFIAAGGTAAGYFVSLPSGEQAQLKADLEIASTIPELAPIVMKLCPSCTVTADCWVVGMDTVRGKQYPRQCRNGLLYAVGVGGTETCAHNPATDTPIPCQAEDPDWAEEVYWLQKSGNNRRLLLMMRERIRRER